MTQHLIALLDQEIQLLETLVACTQREQQHLLAFEPAELEYAVQEKQRLLQLEAGLRIKREQAVAQVLRAERAGPEARTLSDLCRIVDAGNRTSLTTRRDRLKALLAALAELNVAAGIHAERQLRWVRSCRRNLGARDASVDAAYGPSGRSQHSYGGGHAVSTRVW